MKAFLEYNGVRYWDYDFITDGKESVYKDANIVVSTNISDDFLNRFYKFLPNPNNLVPKEGDKLCVIPECKLNLDDIRHHYKIKRGYDTGDFNVFSNLKYNSIRSLPSQNLGIIPRLKTVVGMYPWRNRKNFHLPDMMQRIFELFPNEKFDTNDIIYFDSVVVGCMRIIEPVQAVLRGTIQKPCIFIDNLPLNNQNELTVDQLQLLYNAGKEEYGCWRKDWDKNLLIQFSALNQTNWRDYPGTMTVLLNNMRRYGSKLDYIMGARSGYPKSILNLLAWKPVGFKDEKDFNLTKDFVREILEIKNVKFTNAATLIKRLNVNGVPLDLFDKLFSNMIKIEERVWND